MQSSRFYGKALADVNGLPMIQQVYNRAVEAQIFNEIYVTTGDNEIVKAINGPALMTFEDYSTCTDRVAHAAEAVDADFIINLQGDEPALEPDLINYFVKQSLKSPYKVTSAYCDMPTSEQQDPNRVKTILAGDQIVDLQRDSDSPYKQLGLMAYHPSMLKAFRLLPAHGMNELDLKRFFDNQIPVGGIKVNTKSLAVDTPNDLDKVRLILK